MRLLAKATIVAATAGAAIVFAAPAASGQPDISTETTVDSDVAVLAVSLTLTGNARVTPLGADTGATQVAETVVVNRDVESPGDTTDGPDTGAVVEARLPVEQHVVEAHPTETGYSIELLPTNGNSTVQPLQAPGVISGNDIQVPVSVPVNVCGNTINVVGLLNPAHGNVCVNE